MRIRKAYWIKCDIDGHGERWRIAVESQDRYGEGEDEIRETYFFPIDDFEDSRECFEDHQKMLIEEAGYQKTTEYLASEVAQYMCDRCPSTGYGVKPSEKDCEDCPNKELKKHMEME